MPEQQDQGEEITHEWPGIRVRVASAEYMFAIKASAARVATDSEDLVTLAGHLGITTAEQALAILEKYYSPERLLPKSSLLLESLFPRACEDSEISETAAVQIAQQECSQRGIPWQEPYSVKRGLRVWEVRMPSNRRGGNAAIRISRRTGEVTIRYYAR